jgi:predicted outer membrane repeat protein
LLSGDSVIIADNVAGRGAGVTAMHAVTLNFSGRVAVRGNAAVGGGDGAGLFMSCGCVGLVGGAARFGGNVASPYNEGYGGAIFADDSVLRVGGGAVFDSNRADDGAGGAIYVQAATLTTIEDDALFVGNSAHTGGAFCAIWSPPIRLAGRARFERNSATQGGAVAVQVADLEVSGRVVFLRNWGGTGGAVSAMAGVVTIGDDAAFLGNVAAADGGALSLDASSSVAVGGDVELGGNVAAGSRGGAVSLASSTARFGGHARVRDNIAVYGGAVDARCSRAGLGRMSGRRAAVGRRLFRERGSAGLRMR